MGCKAARSQNDPDHPQQRQPGAHDESATKMAVINAASGALAGAIARFVIGPLDVIKIRFQVQIEPIARNSARRSKYVSLGQAIKTIIKEEGVKVRYCESLMQVWLMRHFMYVPSCGIWQKAQLSTNFVFRAYGEEQFQGNC